LKVGMVGTAKFEARIKELVENLPDLAILIEPLLIVRRALREQQRQQGSSAGTSSVQSVLDTDQSARRLAQITAAGSGRELTMIVGSAIAVRVP
ncbi:MAG: hypothetical protein WBX95_09755, partial [Xanthobacteraceae bacterium]